jgi:hypothetical protein
VASRQQVLEGDDVLVEWGVDLEPFEQDLEVGWRAGRSRSEVVQCGAPDHGEGPDAVVVDQPSAGQEQVGHRDTELAGEAVVARACLA